LPRGCCPRIEAAARTTSPVVAAKALELLAQSAAGGPDWGLGVLARCRALITSDAGQAEDLHTEAITRLSRTSIATDLARAHLVYGEWLRRQRRRGDAPDHLRTAHEMLAAMGAEAFAARAARELRATGAHPRKRSAATTSQLTPRTIEYHLQNIYTKLGITSRAQLIHWHAGHPDPSTEAAAETAHSSQRADGDATA
jgi:Bacterial regulatory proteins, luxR family